MARDWKSTVKLEQDSDEFGQQRTGCCGRLLSCCACKLKCCACNIKCCACNLSCCGCKFGCCLWQHLYSPAYYWFRLLLGLVGFGLSIETWSFYYDVCLEAKPGSALEGLFFALMGLWAVFAFAHLGLIAVRIVRKSEPIDPYGGNVERRFFWPMIITLGFIIAVSLTGIVLFYMDDDSIECYDPYQQVTYRSWFYIGISLLMLLPPSCRKKTTPTSRRGRSDEFKEERDGTDLGDTV